MTEHTFMMGKTALVTGANRGLGREIALGLSRLGARVILACRSAAGAEAVAAFAPGGRFEFLELDLSGRETVRKAAAACLERFSRIDVLVNNAGVILPERQLGPDGHELTFATNVLGPHLLTRLLLPALEAARPARIVTVASTFAGELDQSDLQFERRRYKSTAAYQQSKQANRMLSWEWARRLAGTGVTINAMAPGLMITDLYRHYGHGMRIFMRLLSAFIGVSVEAGADTAIWLASDPALSTQSGAFFEKRRQIACKFRNPEAERTLFDHCDQLLG